MKDACRKVLGCLTAAALLAVLAVPASAQLSTTANGPYYATPSWDQRLTTNRFVILANWNSEAVLDRETGLVWQRAPHLFAFLHWSLASRICIANPFAGRYGWRLPTAQELGSLIDPTATSGPPLPAGHPFIGIPAAAAYWTATADDSDPNQAVTVRWGIDIFSDSFRIFAADSRDKSVTSDFTVNAPFRGWCVRGGLQAAPQ
jgi:hypothetical protein